MRSAELAARLRLIVVTDRMAAAPRRVVDVVAAALAAGAPAVQLRDKTATSGQLCEVATTLLAMTREAGALLFVNDRTDVALAVGADGVHVGPDDLPVGSLRAVVPPTLLIGASTDDPDEAAALVTAGADYIGCGSVYATATKADAGDAIGLEGLDRVARACSAPVVGIGGITPERSAAVAGTSAAGVAVVGAVMGARDVAKVVHALLAPWRERDRAAFEVPTS
jgi:thiamine-phosphate diphosphorylase